MKTVLSPMSDAVVLATHNKHKVEEISAILRRLGVKIRVLTLDDFPGVKPVREDAPTIEGNAAKKARVVARKTKCLALADDTGLFVDALRGAPGVYSARFAGPRCSFEDNNRKMLALLKDVPWSRRGARFRCIAALAVPNGKVYFAEGCVRGKIALAPKGRKGFGYDPVFWIGRYKKTYAEISSAVKNRISHRAQAFAKAARILKRHTSFASRVRCQ